MPRQASNRKRYGVGERKEARRYACFAYDSIGGSKSKRRSRGCGRVKDGRTQKPWFAIAPALSSPHVTRPTSLLRSPSYPTAPRHRASSTQPWPRRARRLAIYYSTTATTSCTLPPFSLNSVLRHTMAPPPPTGMHELLEQLDVLEKTANLSGSINDIQNVIELLTHARDKIATGGYTDRDFGRMIRTNSPCRPADSTLDPRKTPGPR